MKNTFRQLKQSFWRKNVLVFLLLVLCIYPFSAAVAKNIHICTEEWPNYVTKNGKGLYYELWDKIYKRKGVTVKVSFSSFKDCQNGISDFPSGSKEARYDAYVGGAGLQSETEITPKWPLGREQLTVIYKKGTVKNWEGQQALEGKRVGWQQGFSLSSKTQAIIKVTVKPEEYANLDAGIQKLFENKLDFVIDYADPIDVAINKMDAKKTADLEIKKSAIPGSPFYLAFAKTSNGSQFIKDWDEGMEKLDENKDLHGLYSKYGDFSY